MEILGGLLMGILFFAYMGLLIGMVVVTIMLMVRGYKALGLYIKKTNYELEQIEQEKKDQMFEQE